MFDIIKYLESLGHQVTFHGNYIQSNCPIHGGDSPTAFTWWLETESFFCFTRRCCENQKRNACCLIAAILKVPLHHELVKETLRQYTSGNISSPNNDLGANYNYNNLNNDIIAPRPQLYWCQEVALMGYDKSFCRKHRIGGLKSKSGHIYAVAFEVFDRHGRYCGYTKRLCEWFREFLWKKQQQYDKDGNPVLSQKWKHCKGFKSRQLFYGENLLDLNSDTAVLLEGPKDVLFMHRCGFKNPLGTFGLGVRGGQEAKLIEWGINNLVFLYDNDKSGNLYYQTRNFKRISALFNVKIVTQSMPTSADPDDLSKQQLEAILA